MTVNRTIEVLADIPALIERSLTLVMGSIQTALEQQGHYTIALSGGNTPKPLYEAIAQQSLPWSQIHVFWGDERYVPADHVDSNQRMARQAWLDQVPLPAENIHPMPTDPGDPAQAAQIHETHLREFFQLAVPAIPSFDLILLGLGDDGHTASLFPHTPALQVCDRLITVGEKSGQPRLTFTVPLINQAKTVLFVVAGASKQAALSQIFADVADPQVYPARLIQPQGSLIWLLDEAAGSAWKAPVA
jgi:6-phosphogluconolactonase